MRKENAVKRSPVLGAATGLALSSVTLIGVATPTELIREAPEHKLPAARRTALLRRWALLAGSRLAVLEDPSGAADIRAALRVE